MNISNKIDLVETDKLIPYHNNPKEHPTEQIDKIASSIKNYGFVQPLVIDTDNEVIIGHGRLEAAKKLGLQKVSVVIKDDLNDAQIKALRIADNKVAESGWDPEALEIEFEQLGEEYTGFDQEELEDIMADFNDEVQSKEDLSGEIREEFQVIIKCETEAEQEQLYYQLTEEGYHCQVLTL